MHANRLLPPVHRRVRLTSTACRAALVLPMLCALTGCPVDERDAPGSPVTVRQGETRVFAISVPAEPSISTDLTVGDAAVVSAAFDLSDGEFDYSVTITGRSVGTTRVTATIVIRSLRGGQITYIRHVDVAVVVIPEDVDGDRVLNEQDNCPNTHNPEQEDGDEDGVGDACDGCPLDVFKTAPGRCGCGMREDECPACPDGDADGDGVCDSADRCPGANDQLDTDGDGAPDCLDGCPLDAAKTAAGVCGCGTPDADSDGDGKADCNDECPNDPAKAAMGACGCGIPDTDSNNSGVADCVEPITVRVRTVDAGTGQPVGSIPLQVRLTATNGVLFNGTSGADGIFFCPSTVVVGNGLSLLTSDSTVASGSSNVTVVFAANGINEFDLPVTLAPTGNITLTVRVRVGPSGFPQGAAVTVTLPPQLTQLCAGTTDANGRYACNQLVSAGTRIRAHAEWTLAGTMYTGTLDADVVDQGGGQMEVLVQLQSP